MVCKLVKDRREIDKILNFRKDILIHYEGWERGAEPDQWDAVALHFAVFYKNEVLCCLRIIHGDKKDPLCEFLISGRLKNYGKDTIEIGRLVIHPSFRKKGIMVKLFKMVGEYVIENKPKNGFLLCWRENREIFIPWGWRDITTKVKLIPSLADRVSVMSCTFRSFLNSESRKRYFKFSNEIS